MSKLPKGSKDSRNMQAFELMSIAAESYSNDSFAAELKKIKFTELVNYSYGDLSKPGYCCKVVQACNKPKKIYVLNRGLSWNTMNFSGFLEELPDILSIARGKKPEGTGILNEILDHINRDISIEEITSVGHSRGGLIVDYTADNIAMLSNEYKSCRSISIESPGSHKDYNVKNPDYFEYLSSFPSMINSCGTSSSTSSIAIDNYKINLNSCFIGCSFASHKIVSMCKNFENQKPLEKRISCSKKAYNLFLENGGTANFNTNVIINISKILKNMGDTTGNVLDLVFDYTRPSSYSEIGYGCYNFVTDLIGDTGIAGIEMLNDML